MRELERILEKPEVVLCASMLLTYAHKQCETVGKTRTCRCLSCTDFVYFVRSARSAEAGGPNSHRENDMWREGNNNGRTIIMSISLRSQNPKARLQAII